jgi:hypothetical protein
MIYAQIAAALLLTATAASVGYRLGRQGLYQLEARVAQEEAARISVAADDLRRLEKRSYDVQNAYVTARRTVATSMRKPPAATESSSVQNTTATDLIDGDATRAASGAASAGDADCALVTLQLLYLQAWVAEITGGN